MPSNKKPLVERQLKNTIKKIIKEVLSPLNREKMDTAIQAEREKIGQEAGQSGGVDGYLKSNWNYIKNPARIDEPIQKYITKSIAAKKKENQPLSGGDYEANFVANSYINDILRGGPSALKTELAVLEKKNASKEELNKSFNDGKTKLNNNFENLIKILNGRKLKGEKPEVEFFNTVLDKVIVKLKEYWQKFENMDSDKLSSSRLFENKKIRKVRFVK
jgi:hypothetical protein